MVVPLLKQRACSIKRFSKSIAVLFLFCFISFSYLLFDQSLITCFIDEPHYIYSVLLLSFSCFFVIAIFYRTQSIAPSIFLLAFFLLFPLVGHYGFNNFIDQHGSFMGTVQPPFAYPVFIWSLGTFFFFLGSMLCHLLIKYNQPSNFAPLNTKLITLFLFATLIVALLASVLALYRIGYLPLFRYDIMNDRIQYAEIVGPVLWRFSNLWLVSGLMASTLLFRNCPHNARLCLMAALISALGMAIYGQRIGAVLVFIMVALFYVKSHKIKFAEICLSSLLLLAALYCFLLQGEIRGGRYSHDKSLKSVFFSNIFHEWIYYSTVVDEYRTRKSFLGAKIFLGQVATLVPRQFLGAVGYEKVSLVRKYTAAHYFGDEFGDPYGIRITPIGEAYAGFGIFGVIFQMLLFGAYLGVLEVLYLKYDKNDARLMLIVFLLASMMYFPIGMLYMLLAPVTQQGLFVVVFYVLSKRKKRITKYCYGYSDVAI